jgi:hypothetical protein
MGEYDERVRKCGRFGEGSVCVCVTSVRAEGKKGHRP